MFKNETSTCKTTVFFSELNVLEADIVVAALPPAVKSGRKGGRRGRLRDIL